jgi:phage repressor protein C with HTH and peptisase S24 domain
VGAEYLLLDAVLPGRAPRTVGVILHDRKEQRIGIKLRRDWEEVAGPDEIEIFEALEDDLTQKAKEMEAGAFLAWLEDTMSNSIRVGERESALMGRFESTLNTLYRRHVPITIQPFRTHLPVYDVPAAAGGWGREQAAASEHADQWIEGPAGLRLTPDMYVTRITGRSMEPRIPDGSLCVFRTGVTGGRTGRLVLVEDHGCSGGSADRYTVKRYTSRKRQTEEGWQHEEIRLEPLNPEYEAWTLSSDESRYAVIGEFVCVLETPETGAPPDTGDSRR